MSSNLPEAMVGYSERTKVSAIRSPIFFYQLTKPARRFAFLPALCDLALKSGRGATRVLCGGGGGDTYPSGLVAETVLPSADCREGGAGASGKNTVGEVRVF